MKNLTTITNNELLELYTIGNTLTRGWLNRGLESDRQAMREYRKEIKRRGFARIAEFRAACAAEREAEFQAKLAEQEAANNAANERAAEEALMEAEQANADLHPGFYELAEAAGVSVEEVESFMCAIAYRIRKAGHAPTEESMMEALDAHQRDMEIAALNALLEL